MSELLKFERRGAGLKSLAALAVFGMFLLLLAGGAGYTPSAAGASAYQFPGRGDDLPNGHYWYLAGEHTGGGKAHDLTGVRFDAKNNRWTRVKNDAEAYKANPTNEDNIIYGVPVYAMAGGEVISCWRNSPENPKPGESHPGRIATPKTIPRSGNHLTIMTSDGSVLHSAHMQPGSVPAALCPYRAQFIKDADNKKGGIPVETFIPEGQRPKVKQGQLIGRVGNSGASSGPHLHVHLKTAEDGDELSTSEQMLFYGAKVKSTTKLADLPADWVPLTSDPLAWPQAILPNKSLDKLKANF
jgi:hypothetical protein